MPDPSIKPPVNTGEKTISGRIIWNDPETGKDYSERSTTFEIDGKYYTMPTVAKNGGQYTSDTIRDYVKENGPIDYITGEKLPEFRNREDAIEYAISRSSTRKKPKAGMSEGGSVEDQTEEGFGLDALVGLDKPVNRVGGLSKKNAPKPVNAPVGRQSMLLTAEDRSTLADLTPIVGDLKGAYETVDMIAVELAKEPGGTSLPDIGSRFMPSSAMPPSSNILIWLSIIFTEPPSANPNFFFILLNKLSSITLDFGGSPCSVRIS